MIIKTLAELSKPDEASLIIRPLDIGSDNLAEEVCAYRQDLIASFELIEAVPETTRHSYELLRSTYAYGIFSYGLYTVAGNQALLVMEHALRDRFLSFYDNVPIFLDKSGVEHPVTEAKRFDDLYDPDRRLVEKSWQWLKLRSERKPLHFNGGLASLLQWARAENLLGGQRDRWQDRFRVWFRNHSAHSQLISNMPDDAASEIFHLANIINQIWSAPDSAPVAREPMAIAWTGRFVTYSLARDLEFYTDLPEEAICAIVLADPRDLTLGNSFDAQYEMTARPCSYVWGPGTCLEAIRWFQSEQPVGDEVPTVDRLFILRYDGTRLYMPHTVRVAAGLSEDQRVGTWHLIRADYPRDAVTHQQQLISNIGHHTATGFCRACPAESVALGTWKEIISYCSDMGINVTPLPVPDLRSSFCLTPRWIELHEDGQWIPPASL